MILLPAPVQAVFDSVAGNAPAVLFTQKARVGASIGTRIDTSGDLPIPLSRPDSSGKARGWKRRCLAGCPMHR